MAVEMRWFISLLDHSAFHFYELLFSDVLAKCINSLLALGLEPALS